MGEQRQREREISRDLNNKVEKNKLEVAKKESIKKIEEKDNLLEVRKTELDQENIKNFSTSKKQMLLQIKTLDDLKIGLQKGINRIKEDILMFINSQRQKNTIESNLINKETDKKITAKYNLIKDI